MKHGVTLLAVAVLAAAGCSLGRPSRPVDWFSAEPRPDASAEGAPGSVALAGAPAVRLRRVEAAAHLGERIVWSDGEVRYGFREFLRWTEPPVAWLGRALDRELYEVRGLARHEGSTTAALDVELVAFEEVVGDEPSVRVAVVARVTGPDYASLLDRTFEEGASVTERGPEHVARALSACLASVVARTADAVEDSLR